MRRLVFRTAGLAAVTLLALAASSAAAHECMHDHPDLMNEQVRLLANPVAQQNYAHQANRNPGATLFNAQDAQPIRIAFNDEGLRRSGAYCTADGDQVPSYRTVGEKVPCGWFHVLTDEMRDRITQSILVPAINRIRTLVSVERIQGNLRIPSTQTCAETPIPDSHVSDGIADADLVLYLTSVPNPNFVSVWSGACLRDQNLRAIVGRLNFDPSVVRLGGGEAAVIEDVVHELLHILGVSSVEMFRADHKTIVQKRGKDVAVVKTPRVLSFVRSYTGCQELEGAEVEDEGAGATLSTGSHWERKVWFEEALNVMGGTKVSGLSLAFLADINVGYTINTNAGEAMIYGKGDGCGIHNNRCNTVEGGKDRYYCFEDPSNGGKTSQCSWDLKSVGFCAVNVWDEEFPPLYRYFPDWKRGGPKYMDGCPYVIEYANRQCSVPGPETEDDLLYPYVFESNSRCWDGVGVAKDGFSPYFEVGPRCLEGRCTNDGKSQFKSPDTNEWVTCSPQGTTAEMNGGYHGDIVCPSSFDMCRSLGASTTVTPPPSPTTTSAPVTTTTTQAPVTTTTAAPTSPPSTATPPTDSPSNPTTQAPPGETTTSGPSPTSGAPTTTGSPSSPTTAAPGTPSNTNAPSTPSGSPSATTSAPQTPSSTPSATTGSPNVPMPPTTSAPVATEPVPSRTPSTTAPTGTPSSPATTAAPGASPNPTDGNEGTTTQSPSATPTTPQPSTFTFAAQIVVQGSFFARIQGDAAAWQLLQEAVRADLAALLGVDVSRVVIGSMAIGSLIVNYTVTSSSSTEAGIALARSQTLASGNAQLPRTTAEYRKVSPQSGNLTVSQSTTENTDFGSDSSAASQTLVLGSMLLVAVTALVGFASA